MLGSVLGTWNTELNKTRGFSSKGEQGETFWKHQFPETPENTSECFKGETEVRHREFICKGTVVKSTQQCEDTGI